MPITLLKKGEKGRVSAIHGNDDVRHRLRQTPDRIGLFPFNALENLLDFLQILAHAH